MKNLIINNPYRKLGVYVGDSPALEQKNLTRLRAFEKVGQRYEISLVGEEDLPKIERNENEASQAAQQLSLPQDRIRYSLLWFSDGSTDWGKTLNEAVSAIVKGDYGKAITEYNKLITSGTLREAYISAVTHGLGNISSEELSDIVAGYFNEDKGYIEFVNNSTSIPCCSLSQKIYGDRWEKSVKESVASLYSEITLIKNSYNFYMAIDELRQIYAKIVKEIELCRNIFGIDSFEYQEYSLQVGKAAYEAATELVLKIGGFLWNQKYKIDAGYQKYRTKMPCRAIDECMRLIKETNEDLNSFIASLKLNRNTEIILFPSKHSYQNILEQEYVIDPKVLHNSNLRFYIIRSLLIIVWLVIMLTIIFSTCA